MTSSAKNFLIFGGIGGIGGALSELLLSQGHGVFVTTTREGRAQEAKVSSDHVLVADALESHSIGACCKYSRRQWSSWNGLLHRHHRPQASGTNL